MEGYRWSEEAPFLILENTAATKYLSDIFRQAWAAGDGSVGSVARDSAAMKNVSQWYAPVRTHTAVRTDCGGGGGGYVVRINIL